MKFNTSILIDELSNKLKGIDMKYPLGFIDSDLEIYPLGSDTKVLSTFFEMITAPLIFEISKKYNLKVFEPESQNIYPDFTLAEEVHSKEKIAIDVKTTYKNNPDSIFSYTLGSYTSFIRDGNETKNILFPFSEYKKHIIIGFVYSRNMSKKTEDSNTYSVKEVEQINPPYKNVNFFVQEKWKIAGDKAGSGNTANIGSIKGNINDFKNSEGIFENEDEFLNYWKNYGRTAETRTYRNIEEFRKLNP